MDKLAFFTTEEGNFIVRMLIAHFIADFVMQTDKMVESKKWVSKHMGLYIGTLFVSTILLSQSWLVSVFIAATH